jgi:hypothetical protein
MISQHSSRRSARQSRVLHGGALRTTEPRAGDWPRADVAKLGPRIRRLVDDLIRDLLGAITAASAADIGEVIGIMAEHRRLESMRPRRPERAETSAPSPGRNGISRAGSRTPIRAPGTAQRADEGERQRPSLVPHSPFDITSPGDLLASVMMHATPPAEERDRPQSPEAATAASDRRANRAPSPLLEQSPAVPPPSAADIEAASERRPRVVLREGERLLSASGSGVVIRRERRVVPQ